MDALAEPVPVHYLTDPRERRRVLAAMLLGLTAVIASVSGLNVAQVALAQDLGASQSELLWIINGYTLALAALLLPVGAIGDRWGRRPVLLSGLTLFLAGTVGAALSGSVAVLLAARVVTGVGAAAVMPVTLSVITSSFPPSERGRAIGLWAGFAGAGGILGLFGSALVIDVFTWPWVFSLPAALAAASLVLAVRSVPDSREATDARFDLGGAVLSALAVGGLVLGIHEGPEKGWTDGLTLTGLVVGVACFVAFVAWERRQSNPLLDVRLFSDRRLAVGSATILMLFAVMFGLFLVLVQYLQAVLGWSALSAAAGLMPMAACMMPLSTFAPRVAERFGVRSTLTAGIAIFTVGLVALAAMISVDGGYAVLLPGLVLTGTGLGLSMTPSTTAITESLPLERQGVASAVNDTARELGGALGVALLGSVLNDAYRSSINDTASSLGPLAEPVEDGIGSALAAAGTLGDAGLAVAAAARAAFVDGFSTSMWVAAAAGAVALAYAAVRPIPTAAETDAQDDASREATGQSEAGSTTDPALH